MLLSRVDHHGELGPDVPSVGATNWAGGRMAVEYLLSLGHRCIAMITGPASMRCSLDRIAGYRAALEAAGISINPELIRPGDFRLLRSLISKCLLKIAASMKQEGKPAHLFLPAHLRDAS